MQFQHTPLVGVEPPLRSTPSSSSVAEYSEDASRPPLLPRLLPRLSLKLDQPLKTACSVEDSSTSHVRLGTDQHMR